MPSELLAAPRADLPATLVLLGMVLAADLQLVGVGAGPTTAAVHLLLLLSLPPEIVPQTPPLTHPPEPGLAQAYLTHPSAPLALWVRLPDYVCCPSDRVRLLDYAGCLGDRVCNTPTSVTYHIPFRRRVHKLELARRSENSLNRRAGTGGL
ncbi:hypothetical protein Taro_011060, partial [Colocasia esculenta]|nr:hypothetical protein [Colocasia esculenta]